MMFLFFSCSQESDTCWEGRQTLHALLRIADANTASAFHAQHVPVNIACCRPKLLACRVPVPFPDFSSALQLHEHAFAPPHYPSHLPPAPLAVMPEGHSISAVAQPQSLAEGTCKLLSLPSFAKVVYNTNAGAHAGPSATSLSRQISRQLSRQPSSAGATAQPAAESDTQQLLLPRDGSLKAASLEFDSQFESGNLQKAVQASCPTYLQRIAALASKCSRDILHHIEQSRRDEAIPAYRHCRFVT